MQVVKFFVDSLKSFVNGFIDAFHKLIQICKNLKSSYEVKYLFHMFYGHIPFRDYIPEIMEGSP